MVIYKADNVIVYKYHIILGTYNLNKTFLKCS